MKGGAESKAVAARKAATLQGRQHALRARQGALLPVRARKAAPTSQGREEVEEEVEEGVGTLVPGTGSRSSQQRGQGQCSR